MPVPIVYRHDCQFTPAQDASLRALLRRCFAREAAYLQHQRFFRELPPHRWTICDDAGAIVAHIAAYDKVLGTDDGLLPVIGIAEVCVAPEYRGRGWVRAMLGEIHVWARSQGFSHALLFGSAAIYGGSGYARVANPMRWLDYASGDWKTAPLQYALVRALSDDAIWPDGTIDLRGPQF